MSSIFTRGDVNFPYLLENRQFKNYTEGEEKFRIEQKWAVKSTETNSFIEQLPNQVSELALTNTSVEQRGGICIVTATYGEEKIEEDGSLLWYSLSNGKYTMHLRKKVKNDPDAIHAFCYNCRNTYGYVPEGVSVSCSPESGEEYVFCEATFTNPDTEEEEEGDDNTGGSGGTEEEEEVTNTEKGTSVQMASSLLTIPIPAGTYLNKKVNKGNGNRLLTFCGRVESGEFRWVNSGEWGTNKPSKSGWFSTTSTINPTSAEPNAYLTVEYPQDDVNTAIAALKSIPSVTIPQLRVTVQTQITSSKKITLSSLESSTSSAGKTSENISSGDFSMGIPADLKKAKDSEGNEYAIDTKWINEGCSFDVSNTATLHAVGGKRYYTGVKTESWSTISSIVPVNDGEVGSGTNS